jgi:hypothetical protein
MIKLYPDSWLARIVRYTYCLLGHSWTTHNVPDLPVSTTYCSCCHQIDNSKSAVLVWRQMFTFKYKYQAFPFDAARYFTVEAPTQEQADELAKNKFVELFEQKQTVMTVFHRA